MSVDGANRWALTAFTLLALWVVGRHAMRPPQPPLPDPLVAIPEQTALLLSVDVARLRQSELGQHALRLVMTGAGAQAGGCVDPLLTAERFALGFPRLQAEADLGAVGVALSGRFSRTEVTACVRRALAERGEQLDVEQALGFELLGAPGQEAGMIALRSDGLLIGAQRQHLSTLMQVANQVEPGVRSAEDHRVLRELVGVNGTVLLSWSSARGISALPDLRAAALRLDFAPDLRISGVLRCVDEQVCSRYAQLLEALPQHPIATRLSLHATQLSVVDHGEVVRFSLGFSAPEARFALTELASTFAPPTAE